MINMDEKSKNIKEIKKAIMDGKVVLGIELGSTRIKSILIDENHQTIAQGSFDWQNKLENGVWTYDLNDVWVGLQSSYKELVIDVEKKYKVPLTQVSSLGISAMMHGYLVFSKKQKQLVPFRTWRNTITEPAAKELSTLFHFNVPQRWSIAYLHQSILNKEAHVAEIDFMTTLSGYVHWKLTGKRVLGIGDASGMFPIDSSTKNYNKKMLSLYNQRVKGSGLPYRLEHILPKVLCAGEQAGTLTPQGALLIDPSGKLPAGIPLCPPEGDAGTGMTATNSVAIHTGNISAGTSIFAMIVLEKELSNVYEEIDLVTTPSGSPVAMVHCNNFTSDIDAWVKLFKQLTTLLDIDVSINKLYEKLYYEALKGESDGGGLVSFNYYAGEPITQTDAGRPMLLRLPDSNFSLANLMLTNIYSALATLRIGMDILTCKEIAPQEEQVNGFNLFLEKYKTCLPIQRNFFKTKKTHQSN
jgi:sugar (pentulose or hexulose) kinase